MTKTTKTITTTQATMEYEMTHQPQDGKQLTAQLPVIRKSYSISTERKTNRKYVRKGANKWYLDEHLGQYRYVNEKRTSIYIS